VPPRRTQRSLGRRGATPCRNTALVLLLTGLTLTGARGEPEMGRETDVTVHDVCVRIAGKLGSVTLAECTRRDLQLSGGRSVKGTPILEKVYPPLGRRAPRARVLLIGGIHGDELSSVSIVFKWMGILDEHHSGLFHWKVVPLLNPDGLLRRKAVRMNANGVDLNRNFPTPCWTREALTNYWIRRTRGNPRRYPGPSPLSEPESRWLAEEIERFRPDAIVSVHAPHGVVDFDGPPKGPERLGHLHLNLLGTYPGSLGNYAGVQMNIPVVTIELPSAGIMPTWEQIRHIWTDLVRWLIVSLPKETPPLFTRVQAEPS
jgi:protein MpaA